VLLHLEDIVELRQEPLIDVGHLVNFVDAVATMECGGDGKDALVRRVDQFFVDILNKLVLK
jgi:hypothetical protein